MDEIVIAVYCRMLQAHRCSVDAIIETPELREQYLAETRRVLGNLPERELLHKLTYLRKRSKLPRSGEAV